MTYPYRVPVPPSIWERHPNLILWLMLLATLVGPR